VLLGWIHITRLWWQLKRRLRIGILLLTAAPYLARDIVAVRAAMTPLRSWWYGGRRKGSWCGTFSFLAASVAAIITIASVNNTFLVSAHVVHVFDGTGTVSGTVSSSSNRRRTQVLRVRIGCAVTRKRRRLNGVEGSLLLWKLSLVE
jgi:hypothetical protein